MKASNILLIGDLLDKRLSDFSHEHVKSIETLSSDSKEMLVQLSKCDLVITLPNWDEKKENFIAIEIARKVEIEVIHYLRFQKYVQTIND